MRYRDLALSVIFLLIIGGSPAFAQSEEIDKEKAIRAFSYLLENERTAQLYINELLVLSDRTPFKAAAFLGVAQKLLAKGWKPDESKTLLLASANAAVGTAGGLERFIRIALSLGEMVDEERGSTYADLSSLEDYGIPVWEILSKKVGKSAKALKEMSLTRKLVPRPAARILADGLNELYIDAAITEVKRLKGQQ